MRPNRSLRTGRAHGLGSVSTRGLGPSRGSASATNSSISACSEPSNSGSGVGITISSTTSRLRFAARAPARSGSPSLRRRLRRSRSTTGSTSSSGSGRRGRRRSRSAIGVGFGIARAPGPTTCGDGADFGDLREISAMMLAISAKSAGDLRRLGFVCCRVGDVGAILGLVRPGSSAALVGRLTSSFVGRLFAPAGSEGVDGSFAARGAPTTSKLFPSSFDNSGVSSGASSSSTGFSALSSSGSSCATAACTATPTSTAIRRPRDREGTCRPPRRRPAARVHSDRVGRRLR